VSAGETSIAPASVPLPGASPVVGGEGPGPLPAGARRGFRRRHPLAAYAVRRVGVALVLLVVVSVLVFLATNLLPGDVASTTLGRSATPEAKAALRHQLGLDRPLTTQYLSWASGMLRGDLGTSPVLHRPVADVAGVRLENTLLLGLITLVVLVPLSLVLGVVAGARAGRAADHGISTGSLALVSVPEFVLGTVLILVLGGAVLDVFPPVSLVAPGESPLARPNVLVLPVATLVLAGLGYMVRMVRAGVIEVMDSPYVEMARLNGVSERSVVLRHVVPNAMAPAVQALALTIQWLIGGVVVIEALFAYPGIGQALVSAVVNRDLLFVQSVVLMIAALYIVINILADLAVIMLVPKLRTAR
jgi:peptide/nickel transport system permease protein